MSHEAIQDVENEGKSVDLEASLALVTEAVQLAEAADVQLDLADALIAQAEELRRGYSTVKFRFSGIPGGEPGRVNKKG
jgi:hypothetical protein